MRKVNTYEKRDRNKKKLSNNNSGAVGWQKRHLSTREKLNKVLVKIMEGFFCNERSEKYKNSYLSKKFADFIGPIFCLYI